MDLENISRRSFLKKTTVLTVGVASMTLFSGLVNAATAYTCAPTGDWYLDQAGFGQGHAICWNAGIQYVNSQAEHHDVTCEKQLCPYYTEAGVYVEGGGGLTIAQCQSYQPRSAAPFCTQ